jgi:hypothetical protein
MTPNLTSARKAIQAELSHARQGMDFYSARVEALETALTQLESVEGDETVQRENGRRKTGNGNERQSEPARRGRKARSAKNTESGSASRAAKTPAQAGKRSARSARSARNESGGAGEGTLPTTGTDFWLKLVTDEPRSAVEIANAAAQEIGIKPEQKVQIQKLKQRVAPALATLVASKKVRDTGVGRERRFFKKEGSEA